MHARRSKHGLLALLLAMLSLQIAQAEAPVANKLDLGKLEARADYSLMDVTPAVGRLDASGTSPAFIGSSGGRDEFFSREKLSPVLAFYVEPGWEACCERSIELLEEGGAFSDAVYRINGYHEDAWMIIPLSQEGDGHLRFIEMIYDQMRLVGETANPNP